MSGYTSSFFLCLVASSFSRVCSVIGTPDFPDAPDAVDVKVSGLFSDHMALQRDAACPVFGTAAAGGFVRVLDHFGAGGFAPGGEVSIGPAGKPEGKL